MKALNRTVVAKMSEKKKCIYSTCAVSILSGLMLFLLGCSSELGMNPQIEPEASVRVDISDSAVGRGVPESSLRFIELPKDKGRDAVADDGCSAEVVVPRETGVRFVLPCDQGEAHISVGLLIKPYSIMSPSSLTAVSDCTEDVTVSLSVSSDNIMTDVNLVFGPHGTLFDPPAIFVLKAEGLDLTSYETFGEIGFYYYHEDTGLWEPQEATVKIDQSAGEIYVRADLHHFSRYAVAFAN